MTSPGTALTGALLPVAIGKDVADQAASHNSPLTKFRIGSDYHYPTSEAGQWTSFKVDSNNVPTIRDLIATGNPSPLNVGDNIWSQRQNNQESEPIEIGESFVAGRRNGRHCILLVSARQKYSARGLLNRNKLGCTKFLST